MLYIAQLWPQIVHAVLQLAVDKNMDSGYLMSRVDRIGKLIYYTP